jgi:hypothetical protein
MSNIASDWPTHPNGTRKKMRELTKAQQRTVLAPVLAKLKRELESPEMHKAVQSTLF